jgi:hypothetical protein
MILQNFNVRFKPQTELEKAVHDRKNSAILLMRRRG